jgi:hypothetical protein
MPSMLVFAEILYPLSAYVSSFMFWVSFFGACTLNPASCALNPKAECKPVCFARISNPNILNPEPCTPNPEQGSHEHVGLTRAAVNALFMFHVSFFGGCILHPEFGTFNGRGAARANDAQGTPTQSHESPSVLVYEE